MRSEEDTNVLVTKMPLVFKARDDVNVSMVSDEIIVKETAIVKSILSRGLFCLTGVMAFVKNRKSDTGNHIPLLCVLKTRVTPRDST